jgi:prevent-host-death family protein
LLQQEITPIPWPISCTPLFLKNPCSTYKKAYNQDRSDSSCEVKDMQETSVVELRKNIKHYFDAVQNGEVVRVYRKGKPIAEIVPIPKSDRSWKRQVPRLTVPGLSLSREILRDRAESEA